MRFVCRVLEIAVRDDMEAAKICFDGTTGGGVNGEKDGLTG